MKDLIKINRNNNLLFSEIMKKAGWQEIKFTKENFFDDKYFIKNNIFVKLEKIKEKEILLKQLNSTIETNLLTKIIKFIKRKIKNYVNRK